MRRRSDPTAASAPLSNGVSAMVSHSTVVNAYSDLSLKQENLSSLFIFEILNLFFSLAMATAATQVPAIIPVTNPAVATTDPAAPAATPAIRSFISRLSDTLRRLTSNLKPWPEMIDRSAISRPASLSEATSRLCKNLPDLKTLLLPNPIQMLTPNPKQNPNPNREKGMRN